MNHGFSLVNKNKKNADDEKKETTSSSVVDNLFDDEDDQILVQNAQQIEMEMSPSFLNKRKLYDTEEYVDDDYVGGGGAASTAVVTDSTAALMESIKSEAKIESNVSAVFGVPVSELNEQQLGVEKYIQTLEDEQSRGNSMSHAENVRLLANFVRNFASKNFNNMRNVVVATGLKKWRTEIELHKQQIHNREAESGRFVENIGGDATSTTTHQMLSSSLAASSNSGECQLWCSLGDKFVNEIMPIPQMSNYPLMIVQGWRTNETSKLVKLVERGMQFTCYSVELNKYKLNILFNSSFMLRIHEFMNVCESDKYSESYFGTGIINTTAYKFCDKLLSLVVATLNEMRKVILATQNKRQRVSSSTASSAEMAKKQQIANQSYIANAANSTTETKSIEEILALCSEPLQKGTVSFKLIKVGNKNSKSVFSNKDKYFETDDRFVNMVSDPSRRVMYGFCRNYTLDVNTSKNKVNLNLFFETGYLLTNQPTIE